MSAAVRVDGATGVLTLGDFSTSCVIGKGGLVSAQAKREGDGGTPIGDWPIRAALLHPGRWMLDAPLALPWRWMREGDGWCDDPADPAYNRAVRLPRATSAETLQRADQAYDALVVLGHNDAPPVPGRGSAIFLHIWVPGEDGVPRATEGCVAVPPEAMRALLPMLRPGMTLSID